jgi:hypothetical protein
MWSIVARRQAGLAVASAKAPAEKTVVLEAQRRPG